MQGADADVTVQDPPLPAPPRRWTRRLAHALALAAVTLAVASIALAVANRGLVDPFGEPTSSKDWTMPISALAFAAAGWLLATRRPEVLFGWLALGGAVGYGLAAAGGGWCTYAVHHGLNPVAGPVLIASSCGEALEPLVLSITWATFPTGRLPRGWIGRVAALSIALCAAGWALAPTSDYQPPRNAPEYAGLHNPIGIEAVPGWLSVALFATGLLIGSAVMVIRWLAADGEARRVLRWLAVINAFAVVLTPVVVALPAGAVIAGVGTLVQLVVVIAVVLQNRVYGIEVVLNRTLVYVSLTALVAAMYAAGVAVLAAFGASVGGRWTVLAALGAAFSLSPARDRVQRLVNRFLYGERDEPYAVATRVAARLEAAGSVHQLLPGLLEALTGTLRLPSATVQMRADDGAIRSITTGPCPGRRRPCVSR